MRKLGISLLIALVISALFVVCACASGEPSGEPSAEPAASAEPAEAKSIDVTIVVNGDTYKTASVQTRAEGNVYTFEISELLEAFGAELVYDETTDVATLRPSGDGLMSVAVAALERDAAGAASEEPAASGEPAASEEPDAAEESGASGETAVSGEPSASAVPQADTSPHTVSKAPKVRVIHTGPAKAAHTLSLSRRSGRRTV